MVVAYLNLTLIPNTNIKVCLSSGNTSALQDLTTMFSGTFQVPNLKGGAWGQAEIMNYLDSNWIVIPS